MPYHAQPDRATTPAPRRRVSLLLGVLAWVVLATLGRPLDAQPDPRPQAAAEEQVSSDRLPVAPSLSPAALRTRWLMYARAVESDASGVEARNAHEVLRAAMRELGVERWPEAAAWNSAWIHARCPKTLDATCRILLAEGLALDEDAAELRAMRVRAGWQEAPGALRRRIRDTVEWQGALWGSSVNQARSATITAAALQRAASAIALVLALVVLLRHRARIEVDLFLVARGWLPLVWFRGAIVLGVVASCLWAPALAPAGIAFLVAPWARWKEWIALGLAVCLPLATFDAPAPPARAPMLEELATQTVTPCDAACIDRLQRRSADATGEMRGAITLTLAWSAWRAGTASDRERSWAWLAEAEPLPSGWVPSARVLEGHHAWQRGDLESASESYRHALRAATTREARGRILLLLHRVALALGDRDAAQQALMQADGTGWAAARELAADRSRSQHRLLLPLAPEADDAIAGDGWRKAMPRVALDPALLPWPVGALAGFLLLGALLRRRLSEPCGSCGFPSSPAVSATAHAADRCVACHRYETNPSTFTYEAGRAVESAVARHRAWRRIGEPLLVALTAGPGAMLRGRTLAGLLSLVLVGVGLARISFGIEVVTVNELLVPAGVPDPDVQVAMVVVVVGLMIGWVAGAWPARTRGATRAASKVGRGAPPAEDA